MGLKKLGKKLGKVAKTVAKAYVTYQTGGLAGVAVSAASKLKKKAKPMAMPGGVMIESAFPQELGVQQAIFPAVAAAGRIAAPMLGRVLARGAPKAKKIGGRLAGAARDIAGSVAGGVAGSVISDIILPDGSRVKMRRKYRRINPLNVKAARRAIRRIKGVRKVCADIEKQLPRQKSRGAPSCAPPSKKKC